MSFSTYWNILRRRWWIVAIIVLVDVLASGYLYRKAHAAAGYQSCATLYVADIGAPSLLYAPGSTLDVASQALAGETAANFFADDIVDIAQSRSVLSYIQARVSPVGGSGSASTYSGSVTGSRLDRTVNLCITGSSSALALRAGHAMTKAMTTDRKLFLGPMVKRIYTGVVSPPDVERVPSGHDLLTFLLRVILGVLVALGVAFLWDALDPAVRDARDAEETLRVPVLTG